MDIIKEETNNAIICRLKNVRAHPNADRLQLATVCGDTVIVGLDAKENDLVIYFDSNLALGKDYCFHNNLYSSASMNSDTSKKGYFGKNGRVKAQKFRGENSYGYVASLESLNMAINKDDNYSQLKEGVEFQEINGIKICEKYIPQNQKVKGFGSNNPKGQSNKIKTNSFPQHWDTKHFKRCLENIPIGRLLYLEEKNHGTSGRICNCLCSRELSKLEKILKFFGVKIQEHEYIYMNGTRRVNLTCRKTKGQEFYKGDMREVVFKKVQGLLHKNEQIYFEILGYDTNGSWVQKGFPYGCEVGEHRVILYRVTINDEDGRTYDMSREYVYRRAQELGFESPRIFYRYHYKGDIQELTELVENASKGKSPLDKNTLREGVVVWFEKEDGTWTCLKNKSWEFLNLESKQKDDENFIDIEEEN